MIFFLLEPKLEPEPKQSPNYKIQIQIGQIFKVWIGSGIK
jgi:hypothetical protein